MSTNADAYSQDLLDQAAKMAEVRAANRQNKTTVTTGEAYVDAIESASKMKAPKAPPKKAPAAKKTRSADSEDDKK